MPGTPSSLWHYEFIARLLQGLYKNANKLRGSCFQDKNADKLRSFLQEPSGRRLANFVRPRASLQRTTKDKPAYCCIPIINGKKIFASLSDAADFFGVLCTEKKPDAELSRRDTLYLAIPRTAPGLTVEGDWDPLGMRATVSRNLIFKDVFVPDDAALMPQGVYFQAASRWPHMFMTLSPTYMGIAQAAYDFTVAYLRGEIPGTGPVKRRQFATKQIAVAEMFVKLEQTRNLFLRAIEDAKIDPPKSSRLRAYAAQYTIMENAQDIARLAIRTCGGQSMLKSLPLERLYRDARCGSLMLPWTAELCLDRLGRETLYEAGEKDE